MFNLFKVLSKSEGSNINAEYPNPDGFLYSNEYTLLLLLTNIFSSGL